MYIVVSISSQKIYVGNINGIQEYEYKGSLKIS